MLTVMEILSQPLFAKFVFLTDVSGLYNGIKGVGIFDWEAKEDIKCNFMPGEFVITTLSCAKNDFSYACDCLRALIDRGVCAIAIKRIYFKELPEEVINHANAHHVPILSFAEANIEDIIFKIKNALSSSSINEEKIEAIERLINAPDDPELITELSRQINPFFKKKPVCCYCIPRVAKVGGTDEIRAVLERYYAEYQRIPHLEITPENTTVSLICHKSGVLLIYTTDGELKNMRRELVHLMTSLHIRQDDFWIGISSMGQDISDLKNCTLESMYAAATSMMKSKPILDFADIGVCQFLLPLRENIWVKNFYNNYKNLLQNYDNDHNSNLLQTLLAYVSCKGNVALTAECMYQHSNTIRYRLDKIKNVLGLKELNSSYHLLSIFAILYEFYELFDQ